MLGDIMHTLLIDDDYDLYALLSEYLQQEGISCSHAPDAKQGLDAAAQKNYDVVILDVMLPGINGFEVLRRLRSDEKNAALPIIMLTARGREIDRVVGLEMGADDYLGKPFSPRELVARLRALYRRANPVSAAMQIDDISISRSLHSVTVNGRELPLSLQEMRLLTHLAENRGQVVSRDFLYQSIYGHAAFPMDRSLDMLVSRLRKKLGTRADGGDRIKAARGEGYVFLVKGDGA